LSWGFIGERATQLKAHEEWMMLLYLSFALSSEGTQSDFHLRIF
jgi:hypothetical protein